MKEAPQLKEWPTFTGECEYDHMSFIKTIDMLQEDYAIPDELITARLQSLFEKSAKRWYYCIRQKNGQNTWCWWKHKIITKWANNASRYKIENAFEKSFFDQEKVKPLTWFLKQVERLNALYPEMSQKNGTYENTQGMWRRTEACPQKQVYRAMLHRKVYQCSIRHSDKERNWENLEEIGH
ncbi:hypothetical protein O181_093861 [Austropuccinia psidii MF-1]|uniref:Retrotransposon gag domain-containing protein n=1 Tax=Austropuccinia psidii MF-1 TaxID=1389203 RepID=A0A9Q3J2B0_9BASI|nr:hypothetical protein [Austropuccinia psidii MF-1]